MAYHEKLWPKIKGYFLIILLRGIYHPIMEKDDIINWSKDIYLSWSDFKAQANSSSFEDSSSQIKYYPTWTVHSETQNRKIYFLIDNIQLSTQFLRHLSWVREKHTTLKLLNHEQGHFDLAESLRPNFTEKIQNEFKHKKFPTRGKNEDQQKQFAREDSGEMIAKKLDECLLELSNLRKKYDDETDFGLNLTKQIEFDKKFKELR